MTSCWMWEGWKWAYIGWFTVFSKDLEGGAWLSTFSSGVVIESGADHADNRWCTNDAKLAWVDLPSNVARYYLLLFNTGCVAGAWKEWAEKRTGLVRETRMPIHLRVSPSCAPVLSCAQILSSAWHAGYVQYGLFNRDDVDDNNRQQSIVSFFFRFLLPMSYAPKALIKILLK